MSLIDAVILFAGITFAAGIGAVLMHLALKGPKPMSDEERQEFHKGGGL